MERDGRNDYEGFPLDHIKETRGAPRGFLQDLAEGMPAVKREVGERSPDLENKPDIHPARIHAMDNNTALANRLLNETAMEQLKQVKQTIERIHTAQTEISIPTFEAMFSEDVKLGLKFLKTGIRDLTDRKNSLKHSLRVATDIDEKEHPGIVVLARGLDLLQGDVLQNAAQTMLNKVQVDTHFLDNPNYMANLKRNITELHDLIAGLPAQIGLLRKMVAAVNEVAHIAGTNLKLASDQAGELKLPEAEKLALRSDRDERMKNITQLALPGFGKLPELPSQ